MRIMPMIQNELVNSNPGLSLCTVIANIRKAKTRKCF